MKIRLILISFLLSYCSSTGINQEVIQITNLNINSLQNLDSDNETNLDSEFLIINYWASWCLECIEEHDLLISLNQIESFNGKVVLISFQDNVSNSLDFLNKYGYGDLIYLIDNKSEFAINSGVFGVPETHIIKEGKIIKKYIGPLSFSDVEEIIILYS
jgi:cytochrome c biogenesis protein CcmG/thiol:disulfide interchange protein DsbE